MMKLHSQHRGVGTILGVNVSPPSPFSAPYPPVLHGSRTKHTDYQVKKENATQYGCIVQEPSTSQVLHYVEKPDSWISNTVNGGVYRKLLTPFRPYPADAYRKAEIHH